MNQPTNKFQGAPAFRPQQQAARVVEVPDPPLLTIRQSEGRPDRTSQTVVTLSNALLAAIPGFRHGSPVLLVVPTCRGGAWFLDTRPKMGQGTRLPANPRARYQFQVPRISQTHFVRAHPLTCRDASGKVLASRNQIQRVDRLTFQLAGEVPGHPGYYALRPV